jgi:tetratricopeptide (TPR) repeat protein
LTITVLPGYSALFLTPQNIMKNIGRNDPCPCGSGKKYKQCCLLQSAPVAQGRRNEAPPLAPPLPIALEHHQAGRLQQAEAAYQQILRATPQHPDALHLLGVLAHQVGRHDIAAELIGKAIHISPSGAMHGNMGLALQAAGKLDASIEHYRQALSLEPDFAEAHNSLGVALQARGDLDEATGHFHKALAHKPDFAEAHNNLGIALKDRGDLDSAVASYRKAISHRQRYTKAHINLGNALRYQLELDAALESYRGALSIEPDSAEAHLGLGFTLLTTGRLSEGWPEYEYRWEGGQSKRPRPATPLPQWGGQTPLAGERLLIFEEQGFGDNLQFSRYLPLAAERFLDGASLVVGRPLSELFRRSFPRAEIVDAMPADQSAWHWQCPLLSLPLAFGTTLESVPQQIPYLVPDPVRRACWESRIAALGLPPATRKIGVVWKSGSQLEISHLKSLALRQLAPLFELPGCAYFSLQKEPDPDQKAWIDCGKLVDWAAEFDSFDETAALAVNLDLVISVDTSVVHLAAGLGVPTWLINRHASDWRWMHGRADSPWYPTMRIFTQKNAGDWDEVVGRICAELSGGAE